MIFVFGSNLAGRHGAGAALHAAKNCGAIYGQGHGLQGQSYGIPTKDHRIRTLPLHVISTFVDDFKRFARERPKMQFQVTNIGCGLAGYHVKDIAPMFKGAPDNCHFSDEFAEYVHDRPQTLAQG